MTSQPFVASLRARPDTLNLAGASGNPLTIRVQLAEAWDMVRATVDGSDTLASVKAQALDALDPSAGAPADYMVKLGGIEVLDEGVTLAAAGVNDGATLLIAHRRRRAVR
jgi:hypothetical protein